MVWPVRNVTSASDEILERAANRALERLETVLSPGTRERVQALQQTLAPGQTEPDRAVPAASEHVIALAEASHKGASVEIGYRTGDQITNRKIDPYGLAKTGPWYVVAYCHLRQDMRTFRIDRIRSITPTTDLFEKPDGFDAYRHVGSGIAMMPGQGNIICQALLKTDIQTASRQVSLSSMLLEPSEEGVRLTVRTNFYSLDWVVLQLLRVRFEVQIVGPEELKEAVKRLAGRLTAFNA